MNYKKALKEVKKEVTRDFTERSNPLLSFHCLDHTKNVVSSAQKIGNHYKLEREPMFILLTAAWFHDIGYLYGSSKGHENRSAEIVEAYLTTRGYENPLIEAVKHTITAATVGHPIDSLLARILFDADLYHLGTKAFFTQNKLVKKELEQQSLKKIPKQEWQMKTIELLQSHQFQTDYCQDKLEAGKQINLRKTREKLLVMETADDKAMAEHEKKKR